MDKIWWVYGLNGTQPTHIIRIRLIASFVKFGMNKILIDSFKYPTRTIVEFRFEFVVAIRVFITLHSMSSCTFVDEINNVWHWETHNKAISSGLYYKFRPINIYHAKTIESIYFGDLMGKRCRNNEYFGISCRCFLYL